MSSTIQNLLSGLRPLAVVAFATLATGCSDDAVTPIDATDARDVDAVDAPGCGADFFFTGEFTDWDSTTSTFMGIVGATWTVRNQPTRTFVTNPNGRVELCIEPGVISTISVTKDGIVPGIFVAQPAVFEPPGLFFFSSKGMTTARAATFYQSLGLTFDATRAHVLVQKQGTPMELMLTGNGSPFAVDDHDDLTWTAGSSGGLVLFTNVDPAGGQATLTAGASFVGPATLPLEAGTITMTTIR